MRGSLALIAAITLTTPTLAQPRAPREDTTARVTREAEGYLRGCLSEPAGDDRAWCEHLREEFVRDYLRARAGEYQGQRNVAFMLRPNQPGTMANAVQSCAWRMVIKASNHREADTGDDGNMRVDCGRAGDAGLTAARQRAQELIRLIATDPVRNPPPRRRARS